MLDLALQVCFYLVGIPIQIMLISALLRGAYKRFPLVFLYTVLSFIASLAEAPLVFAFLYNERVAPRGFAILYYTNEAILQLTLLAVVVSLIYEATAQVDSRRVIRIAMIAGAGVAVLTSFLVRYKPNPNHLLGPWMNLWSRDMKVCATILVLALWAFLISSSKKNRLLLMLSGAMGILFTAEAIGESLRNLALPGQISWLGHLGGITLAVANIAFLYIWWSAFRHEPPAPPRTRTA